MIRAADFHDILCTVTDKVLRVMQEDARAEPDDDDRAFIARRVPRMVRTYLTAYNAENAKPLRFNRHERVSCNLGGDSYWASGSILGVNVTDPEDLTGMTKLPYVVKLDNKRVISVPRDDYDICRAELCFGKRAGALWFTLFSMPPKSKNPGAERRFRVDERVACAVEDESNDFIVWEAGTVLDVNYSVQSDAEALLPDHPDRWQGDAAHVPYRVRLDSGCHVLVHQDEHWLLRDLQYQPVGPQATKASRTRERLVRRHKGDYTFEAIDHMTRRVRPCPPPASDSEHSDDCDCAGCA